MHRRIEKGNRFVVPRQVLLVEVERRCQACQTRNFIGLTKDEAKVFHGFECARCEQWSEAFLQERDAPEWWEELQLANFDMQLSNDVSHNTPPDESH